MKSFFCKNKKLIFLTLFFIAYYLLITKFGKYLYGSTIDWDSQHYLIPDYFRKLFYQTGNIFPSFAFNLGAGQNIYNLSYYGFLNPVIFISYLLPFISMKSYIQISSIMLVYISVILFYKWISKNFDSKISVVSALLFLFSSPLLFHSHRHIMFINYMPFLILGLIGVDKYFIDRKKWILMLSVLLICSVSYFFSVSAILSLIIYGIYIYMKINKKIEFKTFVKSGIKFLYPIIIGILSSFTLLLPSLLAISNGRGKTSVDIDYLSLFIPKLNIKYALYNVYSLGLSSIILFSLIYIFVRLKKEKRFLGIILSLFIVFPIFVFILNAGMYLNPKVLIPFLPLYILAISFVLDSIIKIKKNDYISLIIFGIVSLITFIFWESDVLFLFDFLLLVIGFLLFYRLKKESIIIGIVIFTSFILFCFNNSSDDLVKRNIEEKKDSTSYLVKFIEDNDNSFYKISNYNGALVSSNEVLDISVYKNSIYSSISNQNYQNFYYDSIGNNISNRSRGELSEPRNLFFNVYMNNKYLITNKLIDELGYTLIKQKDGNYLYKNDNVLPTGYSNSKVISKKDYMSLTYPYNVEAAINYIIVDDDIKSGAYKTNVEKIDLDYSIDNINELNINKKTDYIEVSSKKQGGFVLNLKKSIKNKLLLIKFELMDSNSCDIGDNAISINNIYNRLTCKEGIYNNKNYTFEYTISDKVIDKLDIKFSKGNYKIKNIETFVIDYEKFVSSYSNVSKFNIDTSKTKGDLIEGNIDVLEDGYFNLSIPYDKGFNIYVDNKKVNYEKTDLSFIGFKIKKGKHNIKIVYTSPGLLISKSISFFGIMMFLSTLYIEEFFYKKHMKKRI